MCASVPEFRITEAEHTTGDEIANTSGYLLNRIMNDKGLSPSDRNIVTEFVRFNSQTEELAKEAGIPTAALCHREKHKGRLKRPTKNWFRFLCIMEAIYVENLTPQNAERYQSYLVIEIEKVCRNSNQLRSQFRNCFPPSFTPVEMRRMWRIYFLVVLPCYKMLKGGNVMKNIKQYRHEKKASKGLTTRLGIYMAHQAAQTKK
jgi:hypothetical protein